jgi:hypothetical protein
MTTIEDISAYVFGRPGSVYDQAKVTYSRGGRAGFCCCSSSYSWCSLSDCQSIRFRSLRTGEKDPRPLVSPTPGFDHG